MRIRAERDGLTVQAVAGTHTVLLGFNLDDPTGCLGFGIRRTDHTEDERYWLRGMKTFPSVVPNPGSGMTFSLRKHPVQSFQWGDYTAKPEHRYTYRVVAFGGSPDALRELAVVDLDLETEAEDDGHHGVWFNRGAAASQAFVKQFGFSTPPKASSGENVDEDHPSFAWLSRGLGEAFRSFVAEAEDARWSLRGAFYEFTWDRALASFDDARDRGVDVKLVVHGRDKDIMGGEDNDHTAADAHAEAARMGIEDLITWRDVANKSALQHNKFLVLIKDGQPEAVWTGSMNLTQGAVYGHSNVGHLIRDRSTARAFLDYWAELADDDEATPKVREWTAAHNPVVMSAPVAPAGTTSLFSPRRGLALLDWYADLFGSATSSAHITGAFGINEVFVKKLEADESFPRTVLLDKAPRADQPQIPHTDADVRISIGAHLHDALDQWSEERLTGFNPRVPYVHTKIILVDPLTDHPTIVTGSANYSDNSTSTNEENTVIIRPDGDPRIALRVADIYLTEYHRVFMHFVFRQRAQKRNSGDVHVSYLREDDSWTAPYYKPGHWQVGQRLLFSGSSGS